MKTKVLLLIFTLFSVATWSQGFPVRSADTATVKVKGKVGINEIKARILKEGKPIEVHATYNSNMDRTTIGTANTQFPGGTMTFTPRAGRVCFMNGFKVYSDKPVKLVIKWRVSAGFGLFFSSNGASNVEMAIEGYAQAGSPFEYSFTQGVYMYQGGKIMVDIYSTVAGQEKPYCSLVVEGTSITDTNFGAAKVVMNVGVSISWGSVGTNTAGSAQNPVSTTYNRRFVKWLQDSLVDVRYVDFGFGQSKSYEAKDELDAGVYNDIPYDLLFLHFGENDAASNYTPQSVFKENLSAFIRHRNTFCPKAAIVFITPAASDVSNIGPNISNYRQWVIDVATDGTLGGPENKVYYVNTVGAATSAYNIVLPANPALTTSDFSEKTSGTLLHWQGDTGHLKVFNNLVEKLGTILLAHLRL